MFKQFFHTSSKYQHKSCKDIVLVENHQNQKHTIIFDVEKEKNIECFDFKPFTKSIQSVKICDYVLVSKPH